MVSDQTFKKLKKRSVKGYAKPSLISKKGNKWFLIEPTSTTNVENNKILKGLLKNYLPSVSLTDAVSRFDELFVRLEFEKARDQLLAALDLIDLKACDCSLVLLIAQRFGKVSCYGEAISLLRSILFRLKKEDVRLRRLVFQELGWCLCKSGNSLCGLDYFSKARESDCLSDYINFVSYEGAAWVSVVQDRFMDVSSCVKNKAVVICQEDSIGQTLKQLRYVPLLLEEGAVEVGVVSDHFSEDLFSNSELYVKPYGLNDIGQFDLIALPSLLFAKYCKRPGFLNPEKFLHRNVMRRSDFSGRITVGVSWRSDRDSDRLCSFPITLLKNLFDLDFINLLACQIGPLDETEKEFQKRYQLRNIVDGCDSYGVLADRILENVDVMICADSTPLHLAGALGVPVLGILSANPDWRWFAPAGFASYTSCELHFQEKLGDWSNSLVCMVDYLSDFFENKGGRSNLNKGMSGIL